MNTLNLTTQYTLQRCYLQACGLDFAVATVWDQARRNDHATFYCPNGHGQHYTGETELQKARRQLEDARENTRYARASAAAARDQAAAAERSARAYKGVATRVKNRAAHGVCPVPGCKRSFANVERHVAGQPPDFVADHGADSTSTEA